MSLHTHYVGDPSFVLNYKTLNKLIEDSNGLENFTFNGHPVFLMCTTGFFDRYETTHHQHHVIDCDSQYLAVLPISILDNTLFFQAAILTHLTDDDVKSATHLKEDATLYVSNDIQIFTDHFES